MAQQDLGLLRGRRVIAVNSSWEAAPWVPILFFGDERWWRVNMPRLGTFAGRLVTTAKFISEPGLLRLEKRTPPPALADKRTQLAMRHTSLSGAIGLAAHLGAARIVLLGADMGPGPGGRTHHHQPHPWPARPGCWSEKQMPELQAMAAPLAERGIEVVNTSPVSRLTCWPKRRLEDCLS